jgi:hypothetical protein
MRYKPGAASGRSSYRFQSSYGLGYMGSCDREGRRREIALQRVERTETGPAAEALRREIVSRRRDGSFCCAGQSARVPDIAGLSLEGPLDPSFMTAAAPYCEESTVTGGITARAARRRCPVRDLRQLHRWPSPPAGAAISPLRLFPAACPHANLYWLSSSAHCH